MEGEKDRKPGEKGGKVGSDHGDTTTWRGAVAPPRIPKEPVPGASSDFASVSQSAETIVTESGSAISNDLDASLTEDGRPVVAPIVFERIEPSMMRGEKIRLDAGLARIRVGRSETNEFRLHAPATSRKHAVIERDFTGRWVLTPLAGKSMKVDGYPTTDSVVLEPGMNLVIGGDHIRCLPGEAADESQLTESGSIASGAAGISDISDVSDAHDFRWEMILTSKPMLGGAILFGMAVGVLLWLLA